jgi:nitrogen fixation-related uncharacterized protein
MLWCLTSALVMALLGILIYIYYHLQGQFDDPEEPKYQMLREDSSHFKVPSDTPNNQTER